MTSTADLEWVRRAETLDDIARAREAVDRWGKTWAPADPRRNYNTHAGALRNVFGATLGGLDKEARETKADDLGDLTQRLRLIEVRLGVVNALWSQLLGRVEARATAPWSALLLAADEIVWSTYRGAMNAAATDGRKPPVPIVSTSPEWGAAMVRDAEVHLVTRNTLTDLLARRVFGQLGLRELRVPETALARPWQLSILLHEVGHALQLDLAPQEALRPAFEGALASAVSERWRGWATEVFADACAVAAGGRAILPTLVDWERQSLPKLQRPVPLPAKYPPPIVRWELVRRWGESLGLDMAPHAPELPGAVDASAREVLDEVPAVVKCLAAPLPGLGALRIADLWPDTAKLYVEYGAVTQKRALLDTADAVPTDSTMSGARAAVIAAVEAAAEMTQQFGVAGGDLVASSAAQAKLGEARARLAQRALQVIAACKGPGVRGAGDFSTDGAATALGGWITEIADGHEDAPA